MRNMRFPSGAAAFLAVLFFAIAPVTGADTRQLKDGKESKSSAPAPETAPQNEQLVTTRHTFKLADEASLDYTATAGMLKLKDQSGKPKADIFFTAYTAEGGDENRPVTFAFNGGPGASSIWLHMGVAGPVRVIMGEKGLPAGPPYPAERNPYCWLPWTDLVFIDPVGTGFSRAIPPENAKNFFNTSEDVNSIGEFIQLYVSRFGRWRSPKCLAGESYGAMRAAGLVRNLYENYGMEIDGLLLISPALDLYAIQPDATNDLPYMLFLPSYTAVAWYHKKIAAPTGANLQDLLSESERWAVEEYLPALAKGDRLSEPDREKITARLAGFTGLPEALIRNRKLRVSRPEFTAELLRSEGYSLAFMDGRLTRSGRGGGFLNDPGMAVTVGPYTAALNAYLRDDLNFKSDFPYVFFSVEANSEWNWGSAFSGSNDSIESIRKAMNRNRRLRILAAGGYFDLDLPYFATIYTMSHMGADPDLAGNIRVRLFPGGHMFYTNSETLQGFTDDTSRFYSEISKLGKR